MKESRYDEWISSSFGVQYIELFLLSEVQGLGILDVELLEELSQLKISSKLPNDLVKISRYLILSKLWVIGAYGIIRVIKRITENKDDLKEDTKEVINDALTLFRRIRVPLDKFQKRGSNKESLYSGVADSFIDSLNGAGWKVYEHHKKELTKDIFYRKDLGDTFLNMLNKITQDIYTKYYNK